jgi:hypothetical protein
MTAVHADLRGKATHSGARWLHFQKGRSWFLRYRDNFSVDGKIERKQKCVKLADYCDRYHSVKDVQPLADEKLAKVNQSAKCSHTGILFSDYISTVYLPYTQQTTTIWK